MLIGAFIVGPLTPLGAALLIGLAVPTVGLYRMGALIARGEPAAFSDFVGGMRRFGPAALLVAVGAAILAFVFTTNVLVGLAAGNPLGWFISAMALWGDLGLVMLLTTLWPMLVDPHREHLGLRSRLTLAGLVVIGRPVRILALTFVVVAVLAISTVLFALLVMVSVAYIALVSSRYVLPLADDLEARLPGVRRVP